MDINQDDTSDLLKELSIQDFLDVGLNQVAYIRCLEKSTLNSSSDAPLSSSDNECKSFAIYAADGSQISVMDSYDTAIAAIRINDLFPVTLH